MGRLKTIRLRHSRPRFTLIALTLGIIALGVGVAVGANSSKDDQVYFPGLGVSVPKDRAAVLERSLAPGGPESSKPAPVPDANPDQIPAAMLAPDTPVPVSPEILNPLNAWSVSDGKTEVSVYAGSDGQRSSDGRFVILRSDLTNGSQTLDSVDTPGTGSVQLVDPATGSDVETSAQTGDLNFETASGDKGTLHLADDTVTGVPVASTK